MNIETPKLTFFTLHRGFRGHAQDGDALQARFVFSGFTGLERILRHMGLVLEEIPPSFLRPVPNKSYTFDEMKAFKSEIAAFPGYAQPGHVVLSGQPAFIWVFAGYLEISVSGSADGNLYEVSDEDYKRCALIEEGWTQSGL
ncbi:MAG: hypothetical protein JNN12_01130 [Bacteroidetes Order II. Incertae sedis bacterium]|nr:hypothetical protein [Bacteroidetes Order II. bacterium]